MLNLHITVEGNTVEEFQEQCRIRGNDLLVLGNSIMADIDRNPLPSGDEVTDETITTPTLDVPPPPPVPTDQDVPDATVPDVPPPPAPHATDVELDKAGFPWDERIHGSAKKKLVKEGTWKLIRGVDKALVEKVQAEYLASKGATGETSVPPAPDTPPDAPKKTAEPTVVTHSAIMDKTTAWLLDGTMSIEGIKDVLKRFQVASLDALKNADQDLLSIINHKLDEKWKLDNTPA